MGSPSLEAGANLAAIAGPDAGKPVPPVVAGIFGGKKRIERNNVVLRNCSPAWVDGVLAVEYQPKEGPFTPMVDAMVPFLEPPGDWAPYSHLAVDVECVGEGVKACLGVTENRTLRISRELDKGEKATLKLDLCDLPLIVSRVDPLQPQSVRLEAKWDGAGARTLKWSNLRLAGDGRVDDRRPRLDQFGQRISTTWPGKVESEEQFVASLKTEAAQLAATKGPGGRTKYGGWLGGHRLKPTGFFRTYKDRKGTWWLVDPDGGLFWSLGITGVRTGNVRSSKPVSDRQWLYEKLPDPKGPYASAYVKDGSAIVFDRWNALRRYGSLEAWRDHQFERFGAHGLNTLACWSDPIMYETRKRLPYTVFLAPKSPGCRKLEGRKMPEAP
jgi:hypothetical protein